MGMHEMREELEDLAFRELNPQAYAVVSGRLDELESKTGLVTEIAQQLAKKLSDRGIDAEVAGRRKRAYSIWGKMERKSIGFEQLSDVFGFRVIVESLPQCYEAPVGIVHTSWPVVPGRFKDYISTPKQNDYRSIHTTVIGPSRQRVELQIRTRDMHQIAEYGIAARALYKDGVGSPTEMLSRELSAYAWLRRTIELLVARAANPEEFLEHTKLELFHDQVFCFTPKGKLIALPRRANAIDFAYAVHMMWIEGMPRDESETLLQRLFEIAEDPAIIYEHVWRVGDLIMWDNLACLHARTDWPSEQRRTLRRCTVEGEPLY